MTGLLDTSVIVARSQGESVGTLPDEAAISVMTLAELHVGVLVARDAAIRAGRLRTLAEVEREFDPLPVDEAVGRRFAAVVADARAEKRRPKVIDALIAATALAYGLPLYTRDRDFEGLSDLQVVSA